MIIINFNYKNYRGEVSFRRVAVDSIEFLTNPGFGYQPGWFISGIDLDKNARRSFRFDNIVLDAASEQSFGWKFPFSST